MKREISKINSSYIETLPSKIIQITKLEGLRDIKSLKNTQQLIKTK